MGFRFRKSITVLPGLRINLSKGGVSASAGGHGATVNLGKNGVRGTLGIPGTGLSYSKTINTAGRDPSAGGSGKVGIAALVIVVVLAIVAVRWIVGAMGAAPAAAPAVASRTLAPAPAVAAESVRVSAAVANCRSTPDRAGKVVAKLSKGAAAAVRERAGSWTRVASDAGDCWVSSRLLRRNS